MLLKNCKEEDISGDNSDDQSSSFIDVLIAERQDSADIFAEDSQSHQKIIIPTSNNEEKKVSFSSKIPAIIETMHHTDYTEEEKLRCWYCKADLIQMKREFHVCIKLKEKKKESSERLEQQEQKYRHNREHCNNKEQYFGSSQVDLENNTSERIVQRRIFRTEAWRAVLQEQGMQMNRGLKNVGAIAARYTLVSKQCAFEAYNTGLTDEVEAFRNDDDDNDDDNDVLIERTNTRTTRPLLPHHLTARTKRKLLDIIEVWKDSTTEDDDQQQKGGGGRNNNTSPLRSSFTSIFQKRSSSIQNYLSCGV